MGGGKSQFASNANWHHVAPAHTAANVIAGQTSNISNRLQSAQHSAVSGSSEQVHNSSAQSQTTSASRSNGSGEFSISDTSSASSAAPQHLLGSAPHLLGDNQIEQYSIKPSFDFKTGGTGRMVNKNIAPISANVQGTPGSQRSFNIGYFFGGSRIGNDYKLINPNQQVSVKFNSDGTFDWVGDHTFHWISLPAAPVTIHYNAIFDGASIASRTYSHGYVDDPVSFDLAGYYLMSNMPLYSSSSSSQNVSVNPENISANLPVHIKVIDGHTNNQVGNISTSTMNVRSSYNLPIYQSAITQPMPQAYQMMSSGNTLWVNSGYNTFYHLNFNNKANNLVLVDVRNNAGKSQPGLLTAYSNGGQLHWASDEPTLIFVENSPLLWSNAQYNVHNTVGGTAQSEGHIPVLSPDGSYYAPNGKQLTISSEQDYSPNDFHYNNDISVTYTPNGPVWANNNNTLSVTPKQLPVTFRYINQFNNIVSTQIINVPMTTLTDVSQPVFMFANGKKLVMPKGYTYDNNRETSFKNFYTSLMPISSGGYRNIPIYINGNWNYYTVRQGNNPQSYKYQTGSSQIYNATTGAVVPNPASIPGPDNPNSNQVVINYYDTTHAQDPSHATNKQMIDGYPIKTEYDDYEVNGYTVDLSANVPTGYSMSLTGGMPITYVFGKHINGDGLSYDPTTKIETVDVPIQSPKEENANSASASASTSAKTSASIASAASSANKSASQAVSSASAKASQAIASQSTSASNAIKSASTSASQSAASVSAAASQSAASVSAKASQSVAQASANASASASNAEKNAESAAKSDATASAQSALNRAQQSIASESAAQSQALASESASASQSIAQASANASASASSAASAAESQAAASIASESASASAAIHNASMAASQSIASESTSASAAIANTSAAASASATSLQNSMAAQSVADSVARSAISAQASQSASSAAASASAALTSAKNSMANSIAAANASASNSISQADASLSAQASESTSSAVASAARSIANASAQASQRADSLSASASKAIVSASNAAQTSLTSAENSINASAARQSTADSEARANDSANASASAAEVQSNANSYGSSIVNYANNGFSSENSRADDMYNDMNHRTDSLSNGIATNSANASSRATSIANSLNNNVDSMSTAFNNSLYNDQIANAQSYAAVSAFASASASTALSMAQSYADSVGTVSASSALAVAENGINAEHSNMLSQLNDAKQVASASFAYAMNSASNAVADARDNASAEAQSLDKKMDTDVANINGNMAKMAKSADAVDSSIHADIWALKNGKANKSDVDNDIMNQTRNDQKALDDTKSALVDKINGIENNAAKNSKADSTEINLLKSQMSDEVKKLQNDISGKADWGAVGNDESKINSIANALGGKADLSSLETTMNEVANVQNDVTNLQNGQDSEMNRPHAMYDVDKLDAGQSGIYHSQLITRKNVHGDYVYVLPIKGVVLHTDPDFHHGRTRGTIKPGRYLRYHINKVFIIHRKHGGNLVRFEITYRHHRYFITGDRRYARNAYLQPREFRGHRHVIKLVRRTGLYKRVHFGKHSYVRALKAGTKLRVRKIIRMTKGDRGMTRFYLGHGLYITANFNYVRVA